METTEEIMKSNYGNPENSQGNLEFRKEIPDPFKLIWIPFKGYGVQARQSGTRNYNLESRI